ncbi:MAG TPA: hypothetical protein VKA04_10640, partial [Pseudodesulfovibrio sp.]|nr:hypothetical protein [Pseudodesulfovibrio sp.]
HGLGVVCQINYLMAKGAIEVTPEGRFRPVEGKFRAGIRDITHDILVIQATGDYDAAQKFIATYGQVPEAMQSILDSLGDIPVDVDPQYPVAKELAGTQK